MIRPCACVNVYVVVDSNDIILANAAATIIASIKICSPSQKTISGN